MATVRSVDIARLAGVSQPTVSRVLNGNPRVADATRERVLAVIAQLGYEPSDVARGLVTSRTRVVGVVFSDLTNPFHPRFLEVLSKCLDQRGLKLLFQSGAAAEDERASVGPLLRHRVDGLIFTAAPYDSALVAGLVQEGLPVVLANRYVDGVECDVVIGDNERGAAAAARHLLELGHRRLAMITGDPEASTSRDRGRGVLAELSKRELLPVAVREGEFSYQRAYEHTIELLSSPDAPTAIVCADDLMAFAAFNAASHLGVSVPGHLSIVGFDDVEMAAWESFQLTTVRQPLPDMAEAAVELLSARLAEPERAPSRLTLPSDLIVRRTTAPPAHGC